MKRFSVAVAASTIVPAAVFFAIAARPARLYAETGVPLWCSEPQFTACAGQAANDPCLDGGVGTCEPAQCEEVDAAGVFVPTLACVPPPPCAPQTQIDECTGKSLGAPCSQGACVPLSCPTADGGELLVCMTSGGLPLEAGAGADASPDAGAADAGSTSGGSGAGCSCDTAGGTRGGAGAALGLLLALLALHRAQRRRS